jgi:hypothetical protein
MGKKITQYTAVSNTNPDTGSLLDISEKSGSAYVTKKWSLLQLKTWLTAYLTIPFSSLTGTPTTLSGYGITDALIDGSGTANKLPKFSDSNTLTNSLINDDGDRIWISTDQGASNKASISSSTHDVTILGVNTLNGGTGVVSLSTGDGVDPNYGGISTAEDSTVLNVGHKGEAIKTTVGKNIGIEAIALNGATNYAVKLQDNTQAIGKLLKCATNDGETNWTYFPCEIQLAVSDETTVLTTGTGKITFRMPYAMQLQEVRASLNVAGTTSGITTIDINESGSSILSTKLTIDLTEKTSTTSATPAVISDGSLADDAEITIDIDAISGGATEKGLKILLKGYRLL